jgi:hypothetical protein
VNTTNLIKEKVCGNTILLNQINFKYLPKQIKLLTNF